MPAVITTTTKTRLFLWNMLLYLCINTWNVKLRTVTMSHLTLNHSDSLCKWFLEQTVLIHIPKYMFPSWPWFQKLINNVIIKCTFIQKLLLGFYLYKCELHVHAHWNNKSVLSKNFSNNTMKININVALVFQN